MSETTPVPVVDNANNETSQREKPLTGLDIYERSKIAYARLVKFSKRALAHEFAFESRFLFGSDAQRTKALDEAVSHLKSLETTAQIERSIDSSKRRQREIAKLEANGWRKPRKKRRKRAQRTSL